MNFYLIELGKQHDQTPFSSEAYGGRYHFNYSTEDFTPLLVGANSHEEIAQKFNACRIKMVGTNQDIIYQLDVNPAIPKNIRMDSHLHRIIVDELANQDVDTEVMPALVDLVTPVKKVRFKIGD